MTLSNTAQTLEEAQDTNKRMNRRLGATEAELHRLCSKAMDQVQDANDMLKAANQTISWRDSSLKYLHDDIARMRLEADERFYGGWCLFIWAMTASIIAFMALR